MHVCKKSLWPLGLGKNCKEKEARGWLLQSAREDVQPGVKNSCMVVFEATTEDEATQRNT
jgi:hypothetical protein